MEKKPWVSFFGDPHQRVYISWETEEKTKAIVYYGREEDDLSNHIREDDKELIHHVILENLKEDTKYYYKIKIDDKTFGKGEFKTAPDDYAPFTFAMISDTQQSLGPGWHFRVAKILDERDYNFVVNVGDIFEDGQDQTYVNNYFDVASCYLDNTPLVPVMGNHDESEDTLFTDYFINDINGSKDQFYYSFNWSSIHFQICHFPYGHEYEITERQLNWMKDDLRNAKDMPFRLTFFHCPIKSAGYFGPNQNLIDEVLPILQKYNVDAVIHGHEHHYERGYMGDVVYIILGGGGGALDVGLRPLPETDFLTATPCYTQVKATEDTLVFKTFTLENQLIDKYVIEADD